MKEFDENKLEFPIGYHKFHKKELYNFQLNRWYSMGYLPYNELEKTGEKIEDFKSWNTEMKRLAETALKKRELLKASFYFRAAEFYTFPDDSEKEILYDKFSELFYEFFKNDNIEKLKIPYDTSFLHIMRILPAKNKKRKGTILFTS